MFNWFSLLQLIPIIAAGIHQVHADKDLATKTQLAQEAMAYAVAGASTILPGDQRQLAANIGEIAQQTLAATISSLHGTPPTVQAA